MKPRRCHPSTGQRTCRLFLPAWLGRQGFTSRLAPHRGQGRESLRVVRSSFHIQKIQSHKIQRVPLGIGILDGTVPGLGPQPVHGPLHRSQLVRGEFGRKSHQPGILGLLPVLQMLGQGILVQCGQSLQALSGLRDQGQHFFGGDGG